MTDFVTTVPASNHIEKPAKLTLIFVLNALFAAFLIVVGFLVASDLEHYSNGFKLIGGIHVALEADLGIPGEVFFYWLAIIGIITLIGSLQILKMIRLGFWVQLLGLIQLAVMGLVGLGKLSLLWNFTGVVGVVAFYGISVISVILIIANFRLYRKLGK
jgi:hypothetical protein